uniref:Uncharacterized protein n=1 Tax=Cacopsylla melanoneura TaxID=428564 RepID=A0A8D8SCC8_9HEMI
MILFHQKCSLFYLHDIVACSTLSKIGFKVTIGRIIKRNYYTFIAFYLTSTLTPQQQQQQKLYQSQTRNKEFENDPEVKQLKKQVQHQKPSQKEHLRERDIEEIGQNVKQYLNKQQHTQQPSQKEHLRERDIQEIGQKAEQYQEKQVDRFEEQNPKIYHGEWKPVARKTQQNDHIDHRQTRQSQHSREGASRHPKQKPTDAITRMSFSIYCYCFHTLK